MKLNRIPLKERLERIGSGYAGDEKFNTSVIIRLANIPIGDYLKAFPLECDALMDSLRIEKGTEARQMTYQEVAKRVEEYFDSGLNMGRAVEALNILAMPFIRFYEEKERRKSNE